MALIHAQYAVQVSDEAGYARYRAGMMPILQAHGGEFVLDVRVSEVLRGPTPFNRLFTIQFPSLSHLEAFFANADYLAVRRAHFEPSVREVHTLGRSAVD